MAQTPPAAMVLIASLAVLLAACGGVDAPASANSDATQATTTDPNVAASNTVTTAVPPRTASAQSVAAYAQLEGNSQAGRRVFSRCTACHVVQAGLNGVGPSLHGLIDRPAGTVEGFRYSKAMGGSNIIWTEATLFEYLASPRQYVPGTTMAFAGLPRPQDRADVIAFIKDQSDE